VLAGVNDFATVLRAAKGESSLEWVSEQKLRCQNGEMSCSRPDAIRERNHVWPFEAGWAAKAKWLPAHILILHAEIYPSVRDPLPDEIKDRGQVRAMWQWARDLDCDNLLWREFCRPIEVETGS
jgi:hypothetical protein